MNRRLKIIFCASLLVNLLVIGGAAGAALYKAYRYAPLYALSTDSRQMLRQVKQEYHRLAESQRPTVDALIDEMRVLLAAQDFDPVQFDRVSRELLNHYASRADDIRTTLAIDLGTLAQHDRIELSRLIDKWLKHRRRHHH